MAEAKAIGYLELNISGFEKAINQAKFAIASVGSFMAALKLEKYFEGAIKGAIKFGEEMYQAGRRIGNYDPGKLLLVQKALEASGVSAEQARSRIEEFVEQGRNLADLFHGDKGYAEMLQQAARDYGSQADILSRSARTFHDVFQVMESVSEKVKTFFLAMTEQFLKPLRALLEAINKIDLAEVGAAFGRDIAKAVDTIIGLVKEGKFLATLKDGIYLAFKIGVDYLLWGAGRFVSVIKNGMADVIKIFNETNFGSVVQAIPKKIASTLGVGVGYAVQAAVGTGAAVASIFGASRESGGKNYGDRMLMSFSKMYEPIQNAFDVSREKEEKNGGLGIQDIFANMSDRFRQGTGQEEYKMPADLEEAFNSLTTTLKGANEVGDKYVSSFKPRPDDANQSAVSGAIPPFKVIADSLARVGGGGGFLRVGQNLLEREAIKQTRAQEQTVKELQTLNNKVQPSTGATIMPRG